MAKVQEMLELALRETINQLIPFHEGWSDQPAITAAIENGREALRLATQSDAAGVVHVTQTVNNPLNVTRFMEVVRSHWNFEESEFDAINKVISDPECFAALCRTVKGMETPKRRLDLDMNLFNNARTEAFVEAAKIVSEYPPPEFEGDDYQSGFIDALYCIERAIHLLASEGKKNE